MGPGVRRDDNEDTYRGGGFSATIDLFLPHRLG